MLDPDFEWHQNGACVRAPLCPNPWAGTEQRTLTTLSLSLSPRAVMVYSILKTADICLPFKGTSASIDESGINDEGIAPYRDTQSWCVNPGTYGDQVCRNVANDIPDNTQNIEQAKHNFLETCFAVLGNARTIQGEEAETRNKGISADVVKKACKCNSDFTDNQQEFTIDSLRSADTLQKDIQTHCLCRGLARTTRTVVGPPSLFNTQEDNPEDPAWLKTPDDRGAKFPFCSCPDADDDALPCLLRRICKLENLGNSGAPEKDFKRTFTQDDFDNDRLTDSDGSIAYRKLPVQFVARNVPYLKYETDRLQQCTEDVQGKQGTLCKKDIFKPAVVLGPTEIIVGDNNANTESYFVMEFAPNTDDIDCDATFAKTNFGAQSGLIHELWGTTDIVFEKENLELCNRWKIRVDVTAGRENILKADFYAAFNILDTEMIIREDGGENRIFIERPTAETRLDEELNRKASACLQLTLMAGLGQTNTGNIRTYESLCTGSDLVDHTVTLVHSISSSKKARPSLARSAMAVGTCLNNEGTGRVDTVYKSTTKTVTDDKSTVLFQFDRVCPTFLGIFKVLLESGESVSEICSDGQNTGNCDRGIASSSSSGGVCVKQFTLIPLADFPNTPTLDYTTGVFLAEGGGNPTFVATGQDDAYESCRQLNPKLQDGELNYIFEPTEVQGGMTLSFDADQQQTFADIQKLLGVTNFENIHRQDLKRIGVQNGKAYACVNSGRDFSSAARDVTVFFGKCNCMTVRLQGGFTGAADAVRRTVVVPQDATEKSLDFDADTGVFNNCEGLPPSEMRIEVKLQDGTTEVELVPPPCRKTAGGVFSRKVLSANLPTFDIDAGVCPIAESGFCDHRTQGAIAFADADWKRVVFHGTNVEPENGPIQHASNQKTFVDCHRLCLSTTCDLIRWTPPNADDPDALGKCRLTYGGVEAKTLVVPTPVQLPTQLSQTDIATLKETTALIVCPLKIVPADVPQPQPPKRRECPLGFHLVAGDDDDSYCVRSPCPQNFFSHSHDKTSMKKSSDHCDDTQRSETLVLKAEGLGITSEAGETSELGFTDARILNDTDVLTASFLASSPTGAREIFDTSETLVRLNLELPHVFAVHTECDCENDLNSRLGFRCRNAAENPMDENFNATHRKVDIEFQLTVTSNVSTTPLFNETYKYSTFRAENFFSKDFNLVIPADLGTVALEARFSNFCVKTSPRSEQYSGALGLVSNEGNGAANSPDGGPPPEYPPYSDECENDDFDLMFLPTPEHKSQTASAEDSVLRAFVYHVSLCPTTAALAIKPYSLDGECGADEECIFTRAPILELIKCIHIDPLPHGCRAVTVCTENEYEDEAPSEDADRKCVALSECPSTHYVDTEATPTADRTCKVRPDCNKDLHYYTKNPLNPDFDICQPKSGCAELGTSNRVGSETEASQDAECLELTECTQDTEYEQTAATAATDRECATVTVECPPGLFETGPPTATLDRECTAVSACTEGEEEPIGGNPTPTRDRTCVPVGSQEAEKREAEAEEPVVDEMLAWALAATAVGGLFVALFDALWYRPPAPTGDYVRFRPT